MEIIVDNSIIKKDNRGGRRPGAGRKPIKDGERRKQKNFYLTEIENANVKNFILYLRGEIDKYVPTKVTTTTDVIKTTSDTRKKSAGRKPLRESERRKQRNFYITDVEIVKVKDFIEQMREG